jgi:hypothetical protein
MQKKIILLEPCNFIDFPTGGQLTFAKHLLKSFGNDLVLVGLSTDNKNIGKWTKIRIDNVEYDFFPYWYLSRSSRKPLIPLRFKNFIALYRYRNKIFNNINNIIAQSPDSLLALKNVKSLNLCYYFAGTENPLAISRYKLPGNLLFYTIFSFFLY